VTLGKKTFQGVKWTSISAISRATLQLLLLAIAARYLSPDLFGLYAIVQITLGFCQLFMDMGLGNAIIHSQTVKTRHLSELFIVNMLIATCISLLTYLFANNIAIFFQAEKLPSLIQLVSPSFILAALFRMHLVVLQKELAFSLIAKIEVVAQVIAFSCTLAGFVNGWRVEALIIGYMISLVTQGALYWYFSPYKLVLCWPESFSELRNYFSFGAYQTADATVNYFNSQFDVILVGKLLGSEILGGYALARQFCFRPAMVINPILTRVAFPVMAKLQYSKRLPGLYCKLSRLLASINFPLYLAMAFFAKPLVLLLFGEKWVPIAPTFQLLAMWCLIRSTMNPVGSLLMAIGKVKRSFVWNSVLLLFIPLSVYLGSWYGLTGVASALLILQLILLFAHWYFLLKKGASIKGVQFFRSLLVPLIIGCIAYGCAYFMSQFIDNEIMTLIVGLSVGAITYLLISLKYNDELIKVLKGKLSFE